MTVQPEKTFPKAVETATNNETLATLALLEEFSERGAEAKENFNIPESQENTRSEVTLVIVKTFSALVLLFAFTAAYVSAFGEIERLEPIGQIILLIAGVISPVVTFILGYYFATKTRE